MRRESRQRPRSSVETGNSAVSEESSGNLAPSGYNIARFVTERPIHYQALGGLPHMAAGRLISGEPPYSRGQIDLASCADDESGLARPNEIVGATDPVGYYHRQAASHRLINHQSPWLE